MFVTLHYMQSVCSQEASTVCVHIWAHGYTIKQENKLEKFYIKCNKI